MALPDTVRSSMVKKLSATAGPGPPFVFPEGLDGGIMGETNDPPGVNCRNEPPSGVCPASSDSRYLFFQR